MPSIKLFTRKAYNRPAYRQAQDGGRAITEASYVGLRETAKKVIRGLVKEATKAYE
jgi:hypothetical protein